jgi:hypothetical protein
MEREEIEEAACLTCLVFIGYILCVILFSL